MIAEDKFAFYWKVYDTYYGYLNEDIEYLRDNDIIGLFNISRALVPVVQAKYPSCVLLEIVAPKEISAKRVMRRERGDPRQKKSRIERMNKKFQLPPETIQIFNDGTIEELQIQIEKIVSHLFQKVS